MLSLTKLRELTVVNFILLGVFTYKYHRLKKRPDLLNSQGITMDLLTLGTMNTSL